MMQKIKLLEQIFEHQVFELCGPFASEQGEDYYVPYMMNDALEYYLILKNCRMIREYVQDEKLPHTMQIAQQDSGYVLAVRQGDENAFTIYFDEIDESVKFYQYHEIGHFWVKGQEQWRQLVYMIGTMYDKYQFLGEWSCNDLELNLLPLVEFAPFRDWSPIHETLDDFYPDTFEGMELFREMALEAGDQVYAYLISLYKCFPCKWLRRVLRNRLLSKRRENLYELIWSRVAEASSSYEKRSYSRELMGVMEKVRLDVDKELTEKGFCGKYPIYHKEDVQIIVTEEHPFTIMEWEHYKFKVQFMISECKESHRRNSGFFKGRGRKGRIEKYESV